MSLARHYRTLGLRPGSSGREIKLAYRQLVRRYHPDINPDKQAVERFIKINNAYTAISEATSRLKRRQQAASRISHPAKPAREPKAYSPPQPPQPPSDSNSLRTDLKQVDLKQEPLDLENASVESLKLRLKQLGIGRFSKEQTSQQQETSTFGAVDGFSNSSASDNKRTQSASSLPEQDADLKTDAYLQLKSLLQQQRYPRAIALIEGLAHRMPTDTEISQWQAIVYQRWGRALISQGQTRKARIYLQKALRTDPNNSSLWSEINRDFWQLENIAKATRS